MRKVLAVALASAALVARAAAEPVHLRVGVGGGLKQVVVSSAEPLVLEPAPRGGGADLGRSVVVVLRDAAAPAPTITRWRVRVRGEKTEKEAARVASSIGDALGTPLLIDRAGGLHVVMAGPFDTRAEAEALVERLRSAGMTGARVSEEKVPDPDPPAPMALLTSTLRMLELPAGRTVIRSTRGGVLEAAGGRHRGAVELSVGPSGLIDLVVVVGLEDYLRGVVPKEMGPEVYPAREALRAQAVAARTYAVSQIGRHREEGFDTCAGPHCQVYGGVEAEHPESDEAVRTTAGKVLRSDGRVATAYFSSTCGGHTEAVENVFDSPAEPYLRGVPCLPERVKLHELTARPLVADFARSDGRSADEVLATLVARGVVDRDVAARGGFDRSAREPEVAAWTSAAARSAGVALDPALAAAVAVDTRLGLLRSLAAAWGWEGRETLLAPQDLAAARRFVEMAGLADDDLELALLARLAGVLPAGQRSGWGEAKPTRGFVLEVLHAWLAARGPEPSRARFLRPALGGVEVLEGARRHVVPVAADPVLLSGPKGEPPVAVGELQLKLADTLTFVLDADGRAAFIAREEDPDGAAHDRTSTWSWWSRSTPLSALATNAAELGFTGLRDLRVTKISPAGRVVGIELLGPGDSKREVTGFAVRGVLGLPDLRAHLVLERGEGGELLRVSAFGRGWGHGVGLCQVGAFGMALGGAKAEEILAHYYPGADLGPID